MLPRVAFGTLGCKLNQLETEAIADAFRREGATIAPFSGGAARLFILNTCTVTGKAEQKARRMARAALASDPGSVLLAAGCYAKVEAAAIEALHERALALPGDSKDALLSLPAWLDEHWDGQGDLLGVLREWIAAAADPGRPADPFAFHPSSTVFRSRPALKIQDGCDNRCAYCRVCLARGPSVSLAAEEILERARALEAAGRAEIVLTGVNLSQYRDGKRGFPSLLRLLVEGTTSIAYRVSSYEPDRIDGDFLEAFAHPRVRPHAHLPIQSGSDAVLARMGRRYRAEAALRAVDSLRAAKGDPFIAADLIVGFPGESEADFAATAMLARACGFSWIHAFPFSPRPGTQAAAMGDRVPERVAGERVSALGDIAREGRAAYIGRWTGVELDAVLESREGAPGDREAGAAFATTANYLKVRVRGLPSDFVPGRAIRCVLDGEPPPLHALGDVDALARAIA